MKEFKKKVQVVIIDVSRPNPHVLLLQTNAERGGFWQNVTGSIKDNETYFHAAQRECLEETGLAPHQFYDLCQDFNFKEKNGLEIHEQAYVAILNKTPEEIHITAKEHQNYQWIPINEVTENNYLYKTNYDAFNKAKTRAKRYLENSTTGIETPIV